MTFGATPENLSVSLVNGDVRLTIKEDNLKKVEASSVNGNVKVALPDTIGLEGHAKTSLGSINSRLSNYEVVREKKNGQTKCCNSAVFQMMRSRKCNFQRQQEVSI